MNYTILGKNNTIVYIKSDELLITDAQSALDFIATVQNEKGCSRMIIDKYVVNEEFFKLSNGLAGEIMQKLVNYHTRLAIIGDYSNYTSKSLQDLIYECNKGNTIFFVDSLDMAVKKLEVAV